MGNKKAHPPFNTIFHIAYINNCTANIKKNFALLRSTDDHELVVLQGNQFFFRNKTSQVS